MIGEFDDGGDGVSAWEYCSLSERIVTPDSARGWSESSWEAIFDGGDFVSDGREMVEAGCWGATW